MPSPAVEASRWDGLSWSLAPLRLALGKPIGDVWNTRPVVGSPRPGSVLRKSNGGYLHYVDEVDESDPTHARVRVMWMSAGRLVAAKAGRWVDVVDGAWGEVVPSLPVALRPE